MSMPAVIGCASLAGVVNNNAILFVAFFEGNAQNTDPVTAAVEAMHRRFRSVLLASTTTFVGLWPVVFETSPSLVTIVSVAFAVLASLVLVVLVFPAVLAAYFDFGNDGRWIERGPPTPEARKFHS